MTFHVRVARRSFMVLAVLALLFPLAAVAQSGSGSEAQSSTEALILLLEDDEARQELIDKLKSAAESTEQSPIEETPSISIGRSIATFTKAAAERTSSSLIEARDRLFDASQAFEGLTSEQLSLLLDALRALALVLIVTTVVYLTLRAWSKRVFRTIGDANHDVDLLRTLSMLAVATAIDVAVVLAAWGAGYAAALFFSGEAGVIGVRQSLYLNAFLIVGMVKVAIRALLSPATHELRFIAVSDAAARTMAHWFGMIASVLGYGQLLIVPIVNRQASLVAGRSVSSLIALIAIAIAITLTLRKRRAIAAWFLGDDPEGKPGAMRFAARNWHVPVILYLIFLFLIVAARPDGLIWPILVNSAQVIGVIVAGVFVSGAITRSIATGVHVPAGVAARLPALEGRLNAVVPKILLLVRAVIAFGVLAFALDVAELIDLRSWFEGEFGGRAAAALASIVGILFFSFAIWLALSSWVDFRLNPDFGSAPTAREQTLLSLLRNAATVVLIVVTLMFVLSELGVDIAPLIASAGVLGLAIGFGAQKMVQDIITGVFIQLENAMNVGDVVTLNGTTGVVEKLTIRSVALRDVEGAVHIIPFSSVDMVSNYMKGYGNFVCDMGIAYRENVDDGKAAMMAAFEEVRAGDFGREIIGDLQWFGVQTLGDSAVVLRARIKCRPGQQWAVGRAYNEICKRIMDERGIEIPYPHQTIYFGENKDGVAPPLRMARESDRAPSASDGQDEMTRAEGARPAD